MTELLLGCGNSRDKRYSVVGYPSLWTDLVTLDISPESDPDIVHDLYYTPWPIDSNRFDEVHAYEVLEHIGQQGDYARFFKQFEEIHRILKPNGYLIATVPNWKSMWAWGDPGHTRVISSGSLVFLSQKEYARQVGVTPMTDYRSVYKGDFDIIMEREEEHTFTFALRAVK